MLVRKNHPEMPTMSVALDLLLRVGSPTKYSLSPFKGFANETLSSKREYVSFLADENFDKIVLSKDVFNFKHDNIFYSVYEYQRSIDDEDDEYDYDEDVAHDNNEFIKNYDVDTYDVDGVVPPEYVRRFEDFNDTNRINNYMRTVVYNCLSDDDGYKSLRQRSGTLVSIGDGEATIHENELLLEEDIDGDELVDIINNKEYLIRSMYRLNILSSMLGVNVVSALLAFCSYKRHNKSVLIDKPQFLIKYGPPYYADMSGDCTTKITNPQDTKLTAVRDICWDKGRFRSTLTASRQRFVDEFRSDVDTFVQCITDLGIDAGACDPTLYTKEWVGYYSRAIMVNNYTYICRKKGGYRLEILNKLKRVSLDVAVRSSHEEFVDLYENMVTLIVAGYKIPKHVYNDLMSDRSPRHTETICSVVTLVNAGDAVETISSPVSLKFNSDGYVLSNDLAESLFQIEASKYVPNTYKSCFTGTAYVHVSGWCVFEPVMDVLLFARLEDMIVCAKSHMPFEQCPLIVGGPGGSKEDDDG